MTANIGKRLQEVRKRRGLTQRDLAGMAGVSVSLIRKLEQGERNDTRLETVRRLATVLRIPTTRLIEDVGEPGADPATVDLWASVRASLFVPRRDSELAEQPTVSGVRLALDAAKPLFSDDRFAELSVILPSLIGDADALPENNRDARLIQVEVMQLTGWLLTQTRQFEAAEVALERSLENSSDRLQAAATVNTQCWLLLRQGRLGEARELATRWADDVEPRLSRATPAELSAWGWLLLRVSAAAVRDNRSPEARDAMGLAQAAAVALGREFAPGEDFLRTFGPVTVKLKKAENAMIVDRPDLVLKLASRIPVDGLPVTSNNRNRHLLDVANAHAKSNQYGEAVGVLRDIQEKSPEWLPNQRYARDVLGEVVARRRVLTPEMRSLADAVGLPL